MLSQLKANARVVRTSLGGGQHGSLGLLLKSGQYTIIVPGTPFVYPNHPSPLTLSAYQLLHVTHQITSKHADQVRLVLR